ncbi:MAG TPA: BON domain-containing protein [Longimicrobiales bacterium]|nr:BON domain-containing protein [Longimicrobiales bacterium]
MARYDRDWNEGWGREGRWREEWRGRGRRPGRARPSPDWAETQSYGYGAEYRGRGYPYGAGYLPGMPGRFGRAYDEGYRSGTFGRPTGPRSFGRGGFAAYGPDYLRRGPRRAPFRRTWEGGGLGRGYRAERGLGAERGYEDLGFRERTERTDYRRGRGTEYGFDFDDSERFPRGPARPGAVSRMWGQSGLGIAGGYETGLPRGERGRPRGAFTGRGTLDRVEGSDSDDFGGVPHRHYGHTPPDRWPADSHATPHPRLSDDDIRESVRENLFQDSFVEPERIEVDVREGVVTLRGDVSDFMEARYAWDDAWESPGVRGVINNLTVRTDEPQPEMNMPQTTSGEEASSSSGARRTGRASRR